MRQSLCVDNRRVRSNRDGEAPGRTETRERHRIKKKVEKRLVAEGACQHRVRLAGQRAVTERGPHEWSQPGNLP